MTCGRVTEETSQHLNALTEEVMYAWYTPWLPCTGLDTVRATLKNRAAGTHFMSRVAFQVAAVRVNKPNSPATLAGDDYTTGDNEHCTGSVDISATTATAYFIRFGIAYKLVDDWTTPEGADVALQVSYGLRSVVIGSFSREVVALNDSVEQYIPLTPWVAALPTNKIKTSYVVTGSSSAFKHMTYYQTATTSPEVPDAPTSGDSYQNGDTERCTEQTPTTTGKMWIRSGIQVTRSSGNANKQAVISGSISAKAP